MYVNANAGYGMGGDPYTTLVPLGATNGVSNYVQVTLLPPDFIGPPAPGEVVVPYSVVGNPIVTTEVSSTGTGTPPFFPTQQDDAARTKTLNTLTYVGIGVLGLILFMNLGGGR